MRVTYEEYIASSLWRRLREQAIDRDGGRCRTCNSNEELEVHHRYYPAVLGTESLDALTTLCRSCHDRITSLLRERRYGIQAINVQDSERIRPGHAQRPVSRPAEQAFQGNAQDIGKEEKD